MIWSRVTEGRNGGWAVTKVTTEAGNGELHWRVAEEPGDRGHKGGTRPGNGQSRRRLDDGGSIGGCGGRSAVTSVVKAAQVGAGGRWSGRRLLRQRVAM